MSDEFKVGDRVISTGLNEFEIGLIEEDGAFPVGYDDFTWSFPLNNLIKVGDDYQPDDSFELFWEQNWRRFPEKDREVAKRYAKWAWECALRYKYLKERNHDVLRNDDCGNDGNGG